MSVTASNEIIQQVERLVEEHRKLQDEPLLLAVFFEPDRNSHDIFLFEVIDGFGAGTIDEDQKLFEVSYASTPSFPMPAGQHLRLIMTNPQEFDAALQERWPSLEEIRQAVKGGRSQVLFSAPARPDLEAKLNA
jgi:hypothetical protein